MESETIFYYISLNIHQIGVGHSRLKASLSRFNIVSTAECDCGDGLQTEEHIFWDCKLYEVLEWLHSWWLLKKGSAP
jgi:hypothetical protein